MRFSRSSGVLLHPTSLPGPHGSGDFGPAAHHFVDWLAAGSQALWQMLPLGGIGSGNSPYMSSSAFAGNVLLIDLAELQQRGWLSEDELHVADAALSGERVDFDTVVPFRMQRLKRAARRFAAAATAAERADLSTFCERHAGWLDDYALFMSLADRFGWRDWNSWDAPLAFRDAGALRAAAAGCAEDVAFWRFSQWCFFRQWGKLKAHANALGVRIVGDAPIFIAHQSAEVWARPELFELDEAGTPTVVAGVPPDQFAATGQRWGNPLYRWPVHAAEGYAWWIERVRRIVELVDIVRIDHFRGFAGYWEIPASEPTAERGRWVPGPGAALFEAIARALGPLPIVAEDLGVITPDVDALRRAAGFPGMRILQFAWGSHGEPRFLPHRYEADTVVYTGTHDNDTTVGWWSTAPEDVKHHLREYFGSDGVDVHWTLIRAACASVADLAIHPMQDVLGLSGEHRMNFPGKGEGCWGWRFDWSQVKPEHAARLRRLSALYGREPSHGAERAW